MPLRMLAKMAAFSLSVALMLVGCSGSALESGQTANVNFGAHVAGTIIINRNSSDSVKAAMMQFRDNVEKNTGGSVTLELVEATDSADEFPTGGQFALVEQRKAEHLGSSTACLNEPFLFRNYEHFTMAANSSELLELLGEEMERQSGARPLAAFYTGSSHLVSSSPIGTIPDLEDLLEKSGSVLALLDRDSFLSPYLEQLNIRTVEVALSNERKELLLDGEGDFAEFSTAGLQNNDWLESHLILTPSYHSISFLWLVADSEFMNSLSLPQRAAVLESVASAFPAMEDEVLSREALLFSRLADEGMVIDPTPTGLWQWVEDGVQPDNSTERGSVERTVRQLIRGVYTRS